MSLFSFDKTYLECGAIPEPLPGQFSRRRLGGRLIADLLELYRFRDLLWMWTVREIKIRYKQSILGAAWAILQPLSLTAIFTIVFSFLARIPSDGFPYPVFAYTALLPWTFLATAITFAVPSLVNNMNLVTKIYFPKEILPLGSIAAALFDFAVASIVFVGMMVFYDLPFRLTLAWVPVLLVIQILLMTGVSLMAAAVNVFYRDIRFIVPLGLQLWMYASPVIYPVNLIPERYQLLFMLNPMTGVISSYRRVILQGLPPDARDLLLPGVLALITAAAGYIYFKRREPEFADII